jgi:RND family efflux transporter MFP subunit
MRSTSKYLIVGVGLLIAGVGTYFGMTNKTASNEQKPRNPVQTVKTAIAEKKSIPLTVQANGYVTAINTVDVRPQVQNIVREVHVNEGQEVRRGQRLFTLDERSDSASFDKAKAQLARNRVDLAEAEATLKRNIDLLENKFISQSVVDTARSKVDSLRAAMQAEEAALQASKVSLGNNQISASMNGRIGAISVHPGSLAQPTGAPLLTISQLDPIAVSFTVPERELSHIMTSYPNGDAPVVAKVQGDKELSGKLIFIDNAVDQQSGTIRMKAQFANPKHALWPGAFVNVSLISRTLADAVVVPSQAIVTGPVDKFVYIVQQDDSVIMQKVNVLAIEDEQAVVTGLAAGARIVVEGTQNLRPKSKVKEAQKEGKKAGKSEGKNEGKNEAPASKDPSQAKQEKKS